jgi:cation diffusion facilitator CzcD-associated flavoprotein CzcO
MMASLEKLDARTTLDATVCIIGAGAAGIALACELDGSGFKVILLESGGLRLTWRLRMTNTGAQPACRIQIHPSTGESF